MRVFRHSLVSSLQENGLTINEEDIHVRNEGQFMSIRARYPSVFASITGIKPYLAIEFFLGEIRKPTSDKPVTTLIQQIFGQASWAFLL